MHATHRSFRLFGVFLALVLFLSGAGTVSASKFTLSAALQHAPRSSLPPLYLPVVVYHRPVSLTQRISENPDGDQGNAESLEPYISANGRYVAFASDADNLTPGDVNGSEDVFVYDLESQQIHLVSISSDGSQGNHLSSSPVISPDGRYVAFYSYATNLDPAHPGYPGTMLHDRQTGITEMVSVASDGSPANDTTTPDGVSADGRYVLFNSRANNLVPDDTNSVRDVFIRDRLLGTTELVSIASDGSKSNNYSAGQSMSSDARFVAFYSYGSNLVAGDSNGTSDVFIRDRLLSITTLVSVAPDGSEGNGTSADPTITPDGRYLAFSSYASNLVSTDTNNTMDIFIRDLQTGVNALVSVSSTGNQANDGSWGGNPAISSDGRYVVFASAASNLVPGDTNGVFDIFVHDRATGDTVRVSISSLNGQANGMSDFPSISADGRYITFESIATNLVPDDTNGFKDIFVRFLGSGN